MKVIKQFFHLMKLNSKVLAIWWAILALSSAISFMRPESVVLGIRILSGVLFLMTLVMLISLAINDVRYRNKLEQKKGDNDETSTK